MCPASWTVARVRAGPRKSAWTICQIRILVPTSLLNLSFFIKDGGWDKGTSERPSLIDTLVLGEQRSDPLLRCPSTARRDGLDEVCFAF